MNVVKVIVICLGGSLGLFLLGPSHVEAAGGPAKGKAIYEKYCMACHGSQGKGDGPAGKMLKPPAANLISAESKKKSEADLRHVIEKGSQERRWGLGSPRFRTLISMRFWCI